MVVVAVLAAVSKITVIVIVAQRTAGAQNAQSAARNVNIWINRYGVCFTATTS